MNIGFDFRMGGKRHGGIGRYAYEILKGLLEAKTNDRFFVFYYPHLSSLKPFFLDFQMSLVHL